MPFQHVGGPGKKSNKRIIRSAGFSRFRESDDLVILLRAEENLKSLFPGFSIIRGERYRIFQCFKSSLLLILIQIIFSRKELSRGVFRFSPGDQPDRLVQIVREPGNGGVTGALHIEKSGKDDFFSRRDYGIFYRVENQDSSFIPLFLLKVTLGQKDAGPSITRIPFTRVQKSLLRLIQLSKFLIISTDAVKSKKVSGIQFSHHFQFCQSQIIT